MTTQHTPTPWHLGTKPGPMVYGPQGEQVANMHVPMLEMDEHKANAAFIVHACNAHEELVAALSQIARLASEGEVSANMQYALGDIARAALVKVSK